MKKVMTTMMLLASAILITSCSTDDEWDDEWYAPTTNSNPNTTGGATVSSGELTAFDIIIDKTTAEPTTTAEAYLPDPEDDLNANSFETTVNIVFNGNTASYTAADGVSVSIDGAHVVANHGSTKGICYSVSGTTANGSLTILGEKKYELKLAGVSITNPDSAAVSLLSGKRAYIVVADGTTNTLTDGTTSGNDHKGAFYCKGKMLFGGGNGELEVYGNYNNGIHSADYIVIGTGQNIYVKSTANHGIKANDGVFINGGIVNIEVTAAAAKGINCESNIIVNGGRTIVIATGGGAYEDGEAKAAAGIKCDSTYTQNGGEVCLKATGNGGKGLRTDYEAYMNGGTLRVITQGATYSASNDTSSPKGIKIGEKNVHGVFDINGGNIMVRTQGTNGEGIESKGTISISGGSVQVAAYDDAINSAGNMTLSGGDIVAVGRNSDGIDANGNMYIKGGNIVAFGANGAESGIDTGEQYKLYISGGNIFSIGGRIDANLGSTSQGIVSTSGSVSANSNVSIANTTFTMPPYSYQNGTILASTPELTSGSSYTLSLGSSNLTVTASNSISNSMGGGGMQPGGGRK